MDVEGCCGGVDDGSDAECEIGAFFVGEFDALFEDFLCEVTSICELEGSYSSVVTCFDYLFCRFCVFVVEDGHHAGGTYFLQDGYFIKFCHGFVVFSVVFF